MARTDTFNNWATDVADSIREKTGKTDKIPADQFDTEIKSITTSEEPELQDKTIEITENGNQSVTADEGFDGLGNVDITVNVETPEPNLQTKTLNITENGTEHIYPSEGYDGLSYVGLTIDIDPNLQDKNVTITENGSQSITADTGFDGLGKVDVTVDVAGGSEPNLQDKTITVTENGTQNIKADDGYDGLNNVLLTVNVTGTEEVPIKQYVDAFVAGTINGEAPPTYINPVNDNRAQYIGFDLNITPGYEYEFVGNSSNYSYAVMQIGQDMIDNVLSGASFDVNSCILANTGWSSNNFKFMAVEGASHIWISAKKTNDSDFSSNDLNALLPCYIEGVVSTSTRDNYITDGLIAWWEGEDGFDENARWNSRIGTDYITPAKYGYGNASTNPPVTVDKAVYNNGMWGYTTQQDYCVKDYTIQVVGYLEGVASMSGTNMNMLIGCNMGASPMIGVSGSGNGMFVNGSNLTHEKIYKNMIKRIFNASINFDTPPKRGGASNMHILYSVNGEQWYLATDSNETHTSKGSNITVLSYYSDTYRSLGAKIYSIRVYNRKLTEAELEYNYQVDKAKFGIEDYVE